MNTENKKLKCFIIIEITFFLLFCPKYQRSTESLLLTKNAKLYCPWRYNQNSITYYCRTPTHTYICYIYVTYIFQFWQVTFFIMFLPHYCTVLYSNSSSIMIQSQLANEQKLNINKYISKKKSLQCFTYTQTQHIPSHNGPLCFSMTTNIDVHVIG